MTDAQRIEALLRAAGIGHESEGPFLPHEGERRIILMPGSKAVQFEFDADGTLRSIRYVTP